MGIFCPFLHFSLYLCTMKLHIFNPEHDLALAANLKQFTAPHAGRQLRSDLAFIPALWAEEGDLVLVDDIDFAKNRVRHFGAELNSKVEFITKPQLKHLLKTEFLDSVHPWGWNLSLKGELERLGIPEIMLPTDAVLNKVQVLSDSQYVINGIKGWSAQCYKHNNWLRDDGSTAPNWELWKQLHDSLGALREQNE
jgi:hypothetical protein